MAKPACPVNDTIILLKHAISGNTFKVPLNHRIASEILELLEDLAWGRGGSEHIHALKQLSDELKTHSSGKDVTAVAKEILNNLEQHRETFISHVETHNCATGACVNLAPAPCQMSCPAGIDVPTYVSLTGLGKDAEAIEIIRKDNPFPWVCGLVCTRPCELMCVRGRMDKPVSIKLLKAYAAEKSLSDRTYKNPEKKRTMERKCV